MKLRLYQFIGENNRVDKSGELSLLGEITGTLREVSDVLNPVITLITTNQVDVITSERHDIVTSDGDDATLPTSDPVINNANLMFANYAYIEDFRRYYYITNITSIHNSVWQLTMRVDVLMSYKNDIYSLKALVVRNEYASDPNIPDSLLPLKPIPAVTENEVTNLSTVTELMPFSLSSESDPVVRLTVINDVGYDRSQRNAPETILPRLQNNYLGFSDFAHVYHASMNSLDALVNIINDDNQREKVSTFITSMVAYPFILPSTTTTHNLRVGNTNLATVGVYDPYGENPIPEWMLIADFTIPRRFNDWRDYEPYSQYELFLPYLSYIQLPDEMVVGKRLKVYYSIAGDDGSVQVQIISDDKVIFNSVALVGVQIPLNSTNAYEITTNRLRIVSGMVSGIARGVGDTIGAMFNGQMGASTGNPMQYMKGITGAFKAGAQIGESIMNGITAIRANRPQGNGTIGGSFAGRYMPQKCRLRITRKQEMDIPASDYAHQFGRPLYRWNYLSERFGFTQIADVHLTTIPALAPEKQEIETLLKSGVLFNQL